MLFVFNVGALNIAVLLIRRGLCIPIGTAGFKLFFLSGILGELAHTVLSPNSSDFVYFYCLFCFHNFLSQHKKSIRTDIFFPQTMCYIFCISLKHHRTNECREASRGNAVKVLLTPGWAARGPGKGLCNPAVPEWVCAGLSTSGTNPGLHFSLNQDFCCLTPLNIAHCF